MNEPSLALTRFRRQLSCASCGTLVDVSDVESARCCGEWQCAPCFAAGRTCQDSADCTARREEFEMLRRRAG